MANSKVLVAAIILVAFALVATFVGMHQPATAKAQKLSMVFQGAAPSPPSGCGLISDPGMVQQLEASAPWYCPINQQISNSWTPYLKIAILAVLLSFMIASLIYLIGVATRSDRIRNFGIGELYEAVASALIVFLFLYICAAVFGLLPANLVGTVNPYATAFNLMLSTINQGEILYNSIYQGYLYDSLVASLRPSFTCNGLYEFACSAINLISPIYTVGAELLFLEPAATIGGYLSEALIAIYAQYYLLVFFSVAAIPIFLIPGVIFRAILPTRSFGGILIALGIGFYLVVPSLFSVAYYFTAPGVLQQAAQSSAIIQRYSSGGGALNNALTPSSPLVVQLQVVQSSITDFWLLIIFYPALIIAVTYAFVVELARFLGQAPNMGGRIRGFV